MSYGSRDRISPRVYPWWLILVGFIFGVIVTLVVMASSRPQPTVIYQPQDMDQIWLQATQIIHSATGTAQARDRGFARPEALEPLFRTATAIVAQATLDAPPR